jgi:LDH2 family malate/lactate/ureidoglycolate dehydrogenase
LKIQIKKSEFQTLAKRILETLGIKSEHAALVADSLLDAEIRGVESHGLTRLTAYAERIRKGFVTLRPEIKIERKGCILKIDGNNGLGQIVSMEALRQSMETADQYGCAMAAIHNSNHFGTAGYFTRYAAEKGYIAYIASNAGPTMPPFGGIEPLLGTNPFSVSFPADGYDVFTIDIAMSAVAKGKIRIYEKQGKEIPLGWAMDIEGRDTTDPVAAIAGGLLPMGGHKGYGLAMVVDMLCGILSGANLSCETESVVKVTGPAGLGHFICLMRIDSFMDPAAFKARAKAWFDRLKTSPKRAGVEEIFIPGEIENRLMASSGDTIHVLDKTWQGILDLAKSLNIE